MYIYSFFSQENFFKKLLNERSLEQLIWNLKFHADTVAIFREMNKLLKFTI